MGEHMDRRRAPCRFAAAALCAVAGLALLATSSGAQTAEHASVFQSNSEAAALGAFYTRPGQLPTGPDVVAADLGFSRAQVSILNALGLGAYLWLGDLAGGYKEAVVFGAEAAPREFKDAVLASPDYPFMAKARVPGSEADRSRRTSLSATYDAQDGLVVEAGAASATADSDAATGQSVVGGVRLEASTQTFRNALATLRQQLESALGAPIPAEPGVLLSLQGGRTSSVSRWDGPRLVVTSTAQVTGLSLLEGVLRVEKVTVQTVARSDGRSTAAEPRTTIAGVTVGPWRAAVDEGGVRVVDRSLGADQLRAVNEALAAALAAAGVEVRLAGVQSRSPQGADVASATAAGLQLRVDVERVWGPQRSRLPQALQNLVVGDTLRLVAGAAFSSAAVLPDEAPAPEPPGGTGGGAGGGGAVLGERLAASPTAVSTEGLVPGSEGLVPGRAGPAQPPPTEGGAAPAAARYLGVPAWAGLAAALLLLVAAAALSVLGVWQIL